MYRNPEFNTPEIRRAFDDHDRQLTVNNFKIACVIGMLLMPAGYILDRFVYPAKAFGFLELRLLCSGLIAVFLTTLLTSYGRSHYRLFGITLFMLPASFIAWMIYATDGAPSPYYAGLNLVLLVLAFVLHWTFWESLIASALIIMLYLAACFARGSIPAATAGQFVNNLYFLSLTGIIVVTGSYFHSKSRFREFAFRYQLDKSRQELEETNRKLVELDRLKSQFFANISHELRTPLTLLLSPLETLLPRFAGRTDKASHDLLLTMHANGMRLLKLINDLLDLIRLEAGRMEVKSQPVEVADFIKGLASAARQVAENKSIKLETYTDLRLGVVAADPDKLEKVVLNLLFNALKFTPEGGRVELRAEKRISTGTARISRAPSVVPDSTSQQTSEIQSGIRNPKSEIEESAPHSVLTAPYSEVEELAIVVSDSGIGIAEKNQAFVFDRFWQADSSAQRKYQGVGIGLALVKDLAEMMGGTVTVESKEGQGATFTVRLPYRKAELTSPESKVETQETGTEISAIAKEEWLANLYRRAELFPAMASLRDTAKPVELNRRGRQPLVLVADDEPDMRRFLRSQLEAHYDVLEAADGLQALEKAAQFLPDIILLDMMMPEMDGLAVCEELRKHEDTEAVPIILLTARADEETKFNALEIGANDFLAKPFSSTELHARIKNLIESHDFQRKLSKQNRVLSNTIDQLKETESQLVQSEKLASLGRMSAGIIHEINNPLNFATTGLFALRNRCKQLAPRERREYEEILGDVEEGIKRVRNIVSDLRMFSHPGAELAEPVDVAEAVKTSLRFLASEWKDKVRIEKDLAPDQMVSANRNKLIHVLVNLMQNSVDAMRQKKFDESETPGIWIQSRTEGERGVITLRDNGPGIEQKHLDKIFDPFFTTKDVGEGMGLGLSICHRIVQSYGGHISVKTEVGRFCEFTLDFPLKAQHVPEPEIEHGEPVQL